MAKVQLYHPTQRGGEIAIRGLPGILPGVDLIIAVSSDGTATVPPEAIAHVDEIKRLAGLTGQRPTMEVTENAGS
jgi:hypothetical protein